MKKFFKKLLSVAGPALIGVLGFTGCDFFPFGRVEYGTPNADFKVDITVKDENGNPVKDIRVLPVLISSYKHMDSNTGTYSTETNREELAPIRTDGAGKAVENYHVFGVTDNIRVIFEDTDGDINGGTFAKDSMDFSPVQTGKGDNHWYSGEYTISGTKTLIKE